MYRRTYPLRPWSVQNDFEAADYVRGYAGYGNNDDVTILLAYRMAHKGLAECRGMIPRSDTAHNRRSVAFCIKHFMKYLEHLRFLLGTWSAERWRRAQNLATNFYLHGGVACRYTRV